MLLHITQTSKFTRNHQMHFWKFLGLAVFHGSPVPILWKLKLFSDGKMHWNISKCKKTQVGCKFASLWELMHQGWQTFNCYLCKLGTFLYSYLNIVFVDSYQSLEIDISMYGTNPWYSVLKLFLFNMQMNFPYFLNQKHNGI